MGRSRGGLTSKIHALVDAEGRAIGLALTARYYYNSYNILILRDKFYCDIHAAIVFVRLATSLS
jgi:transposase